MGDLESVALAQVDTEGNDEELLAAVSATHQSHSSNVIDVPN